MTKALTRVAMLIAIAAWSYIVLKSPAMLSDSNTFLKSLVGPDLLAVLGIMVTITLGSAASIHFELNKLEERQGSPGKFPKARKALHRSVYSLLFLFVSAVALLVTKGGLPPRDTIGQALVNGGALLIVLFNALVLFDITRMAFVTGPFIESANKSDQGSRERDTRA